MSARLLSPVLALGLAALTPAGGDWPQWRGPNRDGVSKETGLLQKWPKEGPKLAWTYKEAGTGYAGPAIVGDRLYMSGARGDDEYVYALDVKQSPPKELWAVKIEPKFTWKANSWNEGPMRSGGKSFTWRASSGSKGGRCSDRSITSGSWEIFTSPKWR